MQVSKYVHEFGKACEHLFASVASSRPLTHEEGLLIQHYCNELKKILPYSDPLHT